MSGTAPNEGPPEAPAPRDGGTAPPFLPLPGSSAEYRSNGVPRPSGTAEIPAKGAWGSGRMPTSVEEARRRAAAMPATLSGHASSPMGLVETSLVLGAPVSGRSRRASKGKGAVGAGGGDGDRGDGDHGRTRGGGAGKSRSKRRGNRSSRGRRGLDRGVAAWTPMTQSAHEFYANQAGQAGQYGWLPPSPGHYSVVHAGMVPSSPLWFPPQGAPQRGGAEESTTPGLQSGVDPGVDAAVLGAGDRIGSGIESVGVASVAPSKVVYVRGLPVDVMEFELFPLFRPFGSVEQTLILGGRGQAFVQMDSVEAATAAVQCYARALQPPYVRDNAVQIMFSTEGKITLRSRTSADGGAAAQEDGATDSVDGKSAEETASTHDEGSTVTNGAPPLEPVQGRADHRSGDVTSEGGTTTSSQTEAKSPGKVIMVTVSNMMYAVNVDTLYKVFQRCGPISRIVTFYKSEFRGLIEFADVASAVRAVRELDDRNIYDNYNRMRIQFSVQRRLKVRYNNNKSRDFTDPTLPIGEADDGSPLPMTVAAAVRPLHKLVKARDAIAEGSPDIGDAESAFPGDSGAVGGAGGTAPTIAADEAGPPPTVPPVVMSPVHMPGAAAGFNHYGVWTPHGAGINMGGSFSRPSPTSVIIISGLVSGRMTCQKLFTLCSVYGRVVRIKILYRHPDTALVQFASHQMAIRARSFLHKAPLYGSMLQVNMSSHHRIRMPREADVGSVPLTQDYTGTDVLGHRFRVSDPAQLRDKNARAPCKLLHLANVSSSVAPEELEAMFRPFATDGEPKYHPLPRHSDMCLIEMGSVGDAVAALIELHNADAGGKALCVSFSRRHVPGQATQRSIRAAEKRKAAADALAPDGQGPPAESAVEGTVAGGSAAGAGEPSSAPTRAGDAPGGSFPTGTTAETAGVLGGEEGS